MIVGRMKKLIKILAIIVIAAIIYSLVPVVGLYLKKDPVPYTNEEAARKLSSNRGDLFDFIVFGDNHAGFIFNDSATLKLIWNMNREGRFKKAPVDFVINAGDAAFQEGTGWDYRIYNKIRSLIKWPVISAAGNHDKGKDGLTTFSKYAGQSEISFTNRNSYFIVIDNSDGDLTEAQFSNLEEELKNSQGYAHRFIIAHKTPFSPYQQSWYRPELNPWSYRFMKLCERYKVNIVFAGHEHMFKEETLGGVKYIVSGGGGMLTHFPKNDGGYLHYLVVRVYGDYIDYEVRKIFPPLWEYLAYYMWKDAFYLLKDVIL